MLYFNLTLNFIKTTNFGKVSQIIRMDIINVKHLKSLCIQKIVRTYKIEFNITYETYFDDLVSSYKQLGPSLSRQVFYKYFGNYNVEFHKFLWFLQCFVWNVKNLDLIKSKYRYNERFDRNASTLTNWINKWDYQISEVIFIDCNYLDGEMYFVNLDRCYDLKSINHKLFQLDPNKFNYQQKNIFKRDEHLNKLLKLTIMNCDLLDLGFRHQPIPAFYDLNKGTAFSFKKGLQVLGFPALKCSGGIHDYLLSQKFNVFDLCGANYKHFELEVGDLNNREDILSVIRFVKKTKKTFKLKSTDEGESDRSSNKLNEYLKSLTHLEEVELHLLDISNKQKISIIEALNKSLKTIDLTLFQPISFLLYIGKRFKSLQKLNVAFLAKNYYNILGKSNKLYVKHTKFFDELNGMDLVVFRNLKSFSFFCNSIKKTYPFLLKTILTILKGCQETLTSFELTYYNFADVKQIIDFICSKKIPLEFINFSGVEFLTDEDIIRIVQLNSSDELILKIYECPKITRYGENSVFNYISRNKLHKKVVFQY